MTLRGSALATRSVSHDAAASIVGQVMTVGDTVPLLPRDLGGDLDVGSECRADIFGRGSPDPELLTVTGTDPAARWRAAEFGGELGRRSGGDQGWWRPARVCGGQCAPGGSSEHRVSVNDPKSGQHVQAGRLTEWLKLAPRRTCIARKAGRQTHISEF